MAKKTVKRPVIRCIPEEVQRLTDEHKISRQTLYAILSFANNSATARKTRADALDHGALLTTEEVLV